MIEADIDYDDDDNDNDRDPCSAFVKDNPPSRWSKAKPRHWPSGLAGPRVSAGHRRGDDSGCRGGVEFL
jgi:hypothetical protein